MYLQPQHYVCVPQREYMRETELEQESPSVVNLIVSSSVFIIPSQHECSSDASPLQFHPLHSSTTLLPIIKVTASQQFVKLSFSAPWSTTPTLFFRMLIHKIFKVAKHPTQIFLLLFIRAGSAPYLPGAHLREDSSASSCHRSCKCWHLL